MSSLLDLWQLTLLAMLQPLLLDRVPVVAAVIDAVIGAVIAAIGVVAAALRVVGVRTLYCVIADRVRQASRMKRLSSILKRTHCIGEGFKLSLPLLHPFRSLLT